MTEERVIPREARQDAIGQQNGSFLMSIEPKAGNSPLGSAVQSVSQAYIENGNLAYALQFIKDHPTLPLTDYWDNAAMLAFRISDKDVVEKRFDDATSEGESRTLDMYLDRSIYPLKFPEGVVNPLNDHTAHWVNEERVRGMRPKPFVIPEEVQPVMAFVALDPSCISTITQPERDELIEEIGRLRALAGSDDQKTRDGAGDEMSERLRDILSESLIANDTFISTSTIEGLEEKWRLPFDLFASLKALYTLISGDYHSGAMRQGAVRVGVRDEEVRDEGMRYIIVAGSGVNSAIDEVGARNFANDVLANYSAHQSHHAKRRAFSY